MLDRLQSYLSPKLDARPRPDKGGVGVFAHDPVQAGELLVVWGGYIVTGEELARLSPIDKRYSIQIEENVYLISAQPTEPADYVNHSCDPNAGLAGQVVLVALRDIVPGEEVCFDYAMSDGTPYDEFTCTCGALTCRGRVTGNDWTRPELWERYSGHFSPYLQRRIERLREVVVRERNGAGHRVLAINGKSL